MKMRRLCCTALLVVGASIANAQPNGRFDGRLVDERSGSPIAGATISIAGLSGTTRTDSDGRFTWAPAPRPPFRLIAVLAGGRASELSKLSNA